eukprot:Gb_32792 [translate_table: standard]
MTSYRELSKKAQRANNIWWRLSGLLGDENRVAMYAVLQATFTIVTMALTVPIFKSYQMHVALEILKVSAVVWNGGSFLFEVMPGQAVLKEKKKLEGRVGSNRNDVSTREANSQEGLESPNDSMSENAYENAGNMTLEAHKMS